MDLREAGDSALHGFLEPRVLTLALLLTHAVIMDKILHLSYKKVWTSLNIPKYIPVVLK